MTASVPQVGLPAWRQATIGNVPWAAWRSGAGRSGPRHTSSMPPVPKVILARPGSTHPCPASEACWSPTSAAMGGAPARATASPATPVESTMVGSAARGMRRASSIRSSQTASPGGEPGHRRVGRVGDMEPAAGQVPGHPGVDRADAQVAAAVGVGLVEQVDDLGRRLVGREPQALGLPHEAGADRAEVLPAQAGADGDARGPVPHHGRGPLVGDADGGHRPGLGQRGAGHVEGGLGQGDGVELDETRCGRVGRRRPVVHGGHRGVGTDDGRPHPGGAHVDDEDRSAHGCESGTPRPAVRAGLTSRGPVPRGTAGRACRG